MIPYIHVPDPLFKLGILALHPFGLLVVTGVVIGNALAVRRARARGLDVGVLNSFIMWMLVAGFMGGHMLDQIFYHPQELLKRPWSLFFLWEGLSSFGGFVGGVIGIVLWKFFEPRPLFSTPFGTVSFIRLRERAMPIVPFCDIILSVFPVAWIFGRSGCSVVHDHPGVRATADTLLAVAYGYADPAKTIHIGPIELRYGMAPQYDLGLLELMFTVVLSALLALTWRRKLATGTYVAVVSLAYAPVRFAMDFLRIRDIEIADPRYGRLTPAQWACIALFVVGLAMVRYAWRSSKSAEDPMDRFRLLESSPAPVRDVPVEPVANGDST